MKKFVLLVFLLCYLLSMSALAMPASATEETAAVTESYGCRGFDAPAPMLGNEELVTNARAVILYETNSDTLMYAWNADTIVEPASLAKIMTAWVAVELGNMEDVITVEADVLNTVPADAISVGLQAGEVLSLEELLYCLLVGSANDAAAVVADHVCGSQAVFVGEMNRFAEDAGCKDTLFTNALGLYDEKQYTTARDMGRILAAALKNEQFRTIFSTTSHSVPATNKSEVRHVATNNYLINGNSDKVEFYCDSRVTGGRTGITSDGKRSVAVTAETGNLELISIIIGADSEIAKDGYSVLTFGGYLETSKLLDQGFADRQVAQILYENQTLTQQPVANGDCDVILGPNVSVFAVLPQNIQQEDLSYKYTMDSASLQAPITKGDRLAEVQVWHDNLCVAQSELYAMNDVSVEQVAVAEPVEEKQESGGFPKVLTVIGIVLAVIVGALLLLRLARKVRYAAANKRNRRNSRNRRRSR